jgi:hypothetical protein
MNGSAHDNCCCLRGSPLFSFTRLRHKFIVLLFLLREFLVKQIMLLFVYIDDYDDFVLPTKRVKRQPRTADELWVMHEHLTDGITDVLKHITAVNFYTPLGCLAQMHALSGAKRFHAKDMTRKFQQMFSVSISF